MRWFFFSFSILFCLSSSSGQVLLNEVYYDHPGRDEGHEFVELVNISAAARGLDGIRLEFHDGASSGWVTIWEAQPDDTIAGLGGLFLIGGDSLGSLCDAILEFDLQNGPDAVRLAAPEGILDLVGYGLLDDPAYYEGSSGPDTPSGSSLARIPDGNDTNDNHVDFVVGVPSPGRFNVPRDDVMIRLGAQTPRRFVWPGGTTETIAIRVHNNGLRAVRRQTAVVQLEDSTRFGVRNAGTMINEVDLPPGDSLDVTFAVDFNPGYHFVSACVTYPPDERTDNNRLDIIRRVGPPPVIVSEVMSHPGSGCPEYIELFNLAGEPYGLAGLWVRDAAHEPVRVGASDGILEPGCFAVLTSDEDALRACFPDIHGVVIESDGAWPSLNHTGSGGVADSVIILDSFLLVVDQVGYPPQPSNTKGRSLERVDLYVSSGSAIWLLSNNPLGGSPGWRHEETVLSRPDGHAVRVAPNPFDPWWGENLLVTIPSQGVPSRVHVAVFDLNGRRVKDVGSTVQLPSVVTWDGTDDGGTRVVPGFYLVACEFVSLELDDRRVEKVVVGCARKTKR